MHCAADAGAAELDFDVHQAELFSLLHYLMDAQRVVGLLLKSNCMSYSGQMEKQNGERVCVI